jgi:hypothetical protein
MSNSLFSYGMPSSGSKLPMKSAATNNQQLSVKSRYDDLTIISRIVYLMSLVTKVK